MSQTGERAALLIYLDNRDPLEIAIDFRDLPNVMGQVSEEAARFFGDMLAVVGQATGSVVVSVDEYKFCEGQHIPMGDGTLAEIHSVWSNAEIASRYSYIHGLENIYASGFVTHMAQRAGVIAKGQAFPVDGRLLLFVEKTDKRASQADYSDAFADSMQANAGSIQDAISDVLLNMGGFDEDEVDELMKRITTTLETQDDITELLKEIKERLDDKDK